MGNVNKHILVGRLGGEPELRFIPSGKAVCTFNLATEQTWKDAQGQRQKKTNWHRIVIWGPAAENAAKYLAKGREVYLEGKVETREYQDKDGNKRYTTETVVHEMQFLSGNQQGGGGARPPTPGQAPGGGGAGGDYGGPMPSDDDVPFIVGTPGANGL